MVPGLPAEVLAAGWLDCSGENDFPSVAVAH